MILPQSETAFAKINLALHIRRRRDDGYHDLETLFAFLDCGDRLTATAAPQFALIEAGRFGADAGPIEHNLVTHAARAAHGGTLPPIRFDLEKRLPVAAGLGGGSADAAAVLRMMGAGDRHDLAATLGADVPACLDSVPVIGLGTGTELKPVVNDVAGLACLLVNPGVPLATGPVFKAWDGIDRGPIAEGSARAIAMAGRNDLERPARHLCPIIGDVLDALAETAPIVSRMSGSGASCFALYASDREASAAEQAILQSGQRNWWTLRGLLR